GIAIAAVEHAEAGPLLDELAAVALRARHAGRLGRVLLHVVALRVPAAPHERPVPAHAPLEPAPAFRTRLVQELRFGALGPIHVPDVPALRVVRAPDELAVAAELHLEPAGLAALLRTERTALVELLRVPFERVLGLLERALERAVELLEHLHLA